VQQRQTVLWALVAFFGASITFNLINDATEGEPIALRLGAQLAALLVIVGVVVLIARRRG